MKVKRPEKLPIILTKQEVRSILSQVKVLDYRACLELMYACGLRIGEVIKLMPADINGERKILHVKNGKGKKTELFQSLITSMRSYGNTGFPIRTGISCFQPDLLLIEKRQTYLLKGVCFKLFLKRLWLSRELSGRQHLTLCVIPMRLIFWTLALISGSFRSIWDTVP